MKNAVVAILLVALSLFVSAPAFSRNDTGQGDILVRFKDQESLAPQRHLADSLGYSEVRHFRQFNISRWRPHESRGLSLKRTLEILRSDPNVEWAEPNYSRYADKVPNDPLFSNQWHLLNTGQAGGTAGADIQAESAWAITTGGSKVVVAVLDTGIDYDHPDLNGNMWTNPGEDWLQSGEPGRNGIDDDNNGYVDDYFGISVVPEPEIPPFTRWPGDSIDTIGHGTHVSGIIGAAGNNALGVSGINWKTQLMSLKFIGSQGGDVAGVIECIAYILDQKQKGTPVRIVNASFGGSSYSQFEKEAYESLGDRGILIAASAGNSGADLDGTARNYPGSYNLENIINVAATTRHDQLATFSNYGLFSVHLGAPGSEIKSTYLGDTYEVFGGTSMAAPQVSGALAILFSAKEQTLLEAKERILRGTDPLESLKGKVFTGGRLNLYKALTVALTGPFIFSLSPVTGSPGTEVTLTGVRFGPWQNDSRVLFSGMEADILDWNDNKIECLIPEVGLNSEIVVINSEGTSNKVFLTLAPYRYYLPFAPSGYPWVSFLILTSFDDETVNLKVMASEAGAYFWNTFSERLMPKQSVYRNIRTYGLNGSKNILWVESDKHLQVAILVAYSDAGLMDLTFIRAERR